MAQVGFYLGTLVFFFFANSILNFGLNIQFGYTGILNFAYIAFMATGAYMTGVLTLGPPAAGSNEFYVIGAHLPFPVPLLLGGVSAMALGLLAGVVAFRRLRSDYLAIVMISVAAVLYDVVQNDVRLFDGADGLTGVPEPFAAWLHLNPNTFIYAYAVFAGLVMIVLWIVLSRITRSPLGRTFRAIRDDPDVARALGKNVFRYQLTALLIGSFYAGIAGGLIMEFAGAFNTSGWAMGETFVIFAALLIGGAGNNLGAVLGALIVPVLFVEAPRFLPPIPGRPDLIPAIRNVLIGVLLMATLWFRPQGLLPERRRRFKLPEPRTEAVPDAVEQPEASA